MPAMEIRGNHINYRLVGDDGPWIALSPGGRRGMEAVVTLAGRMAAAGYRVVIHDRRNCGASDVAIDGEDSEYELWADDLHMLLSELEALPAIVGGASSGCRTSILFALRHPQAVSALLLWRVTGGAWGSIVGWPASVERPASRKSPVSVAMRMTTAPVRTSGSSVGSTLCVLTILVASRAESR